MSNTFSSLDDVFEENRQVQESRFDYKKLNVNQPFSQFRLDVGQEQDIVFLGEDVLGRYEHNVRSTKKDGSTIYTSVACLGDECPICDAVTDGGQIGKRRLITYFNVMAVGNFKTYDWDEKEVLEKESPNLILLATSQTLEQIKEFRGKNKGKLNGMQLTMKRTGKDKAPRVGDIVYPSGKLTDNDIVELKSSAFDDMYDFDEITTTLDYTDAKNYVKLIMGNRAPKQSTNTGQFRQQKTVGWE